LHGSLKTTISKAKAVQPLVEKIITKAKKGDQASLKVIRKTLHDRILVNRLLSDAKSRFGTRNSGFTRIIKIGPRSGDNAEMAILSFVDNAQNIPDQKEAEFKKNEPKIKPVVSKNKKTVEKTGKISKKSVRVKKKI